MPVRAVGDRPAFAHSRLHHGQPDVVAVCEWKRGDFCCGDDRAQHTCRALDQRGFRRDRHRLLNRSQLEHHVDDGFLPDEQANAAPYRRPEAWKLRPDLIRTHRQCRKPVGPVLTGRNAPRQARIHIPDGDRRTWHNAPGIPDHTDNGGRGLREERRGTDHEKQDG